MKAVMPSVLPDVLAWRKKTGADRWDEMWDGVLHMPPMPTDDHQNLEGSLESWLRVHWAQGSGARVRHQINVASVGGWPDKNYRIPDLVLLTPERFAINKGAYYEGGPDVVVEIKSPGDETYEKLDFYAQIGVREVWIIDRDTKQPAIYIPSSSGLKEKSFAPDGWVHSDVTGIEMKIGQPGKLAVRLAGNESTFAELPED